MFFYFFYVNGIYFAKSKQVDFILFQEILNDLFVESGNLLVDFLFLLFLFCYRRRNASVPPGNIYFHVNSLGLLGHDVDSAIVRRGIL
ncbi:hypothetical protein B6S59_02200 [Pseudomonas sp. A46]|nr:hypothetical protein B6S59_02200 [Pseudomonas sp. A46]